MDNVLTLVLGGGHGTRLYPLTKYRSKPAVPLAGKYRLIDIPLSNCINSGLDRIYVLTQFMSVSLHRHIRRTYNFDAFGGGYVEVLAAQQTLESTDWYQGTADAVRQQISHVQQPGVDYVLILSGDQLYRMDFEKMLNTHQQANADVTIAAMPVSQDDAKSLGVMRMDESGRVVGFLEKPQTAEELKLVSMDPTWLEARGIESCGRDCLASMGIYLFNRDTLVDVLTKTAYQDFGKEVFPASIRSRHVHSHLFDGYWEDIGTIKSFYQANLDLASSSPSFHMSSGDSPLYTRARFLPPTRIDGATVQGSLIADGCTIEEGAFIENSVVGLRCRIGKNVVVRNSILMGADFYETSQDLKRSTENRPAGNQTAIPIGVGEGSLIDGAIIDKNCRIGRNVRVVNEQNVENSEETEHGMIRDGIIVVPKGGLLPDGHSS